MSTRTATVQWVTKPVSTRDGEAAAEVVTSYEPACERAFWLRLDDPLPPEGVRITYGDRHATWSEGDLTMTARKLDGNHDPDAPSS